MNILIVDDEKLILLYLKKILNTLGHNIVGTATNGNDAISMAKKLKPDLILLDICMPGDCDGIEAAKVIGKYSNIPIIFTTAYPEGLNKERLSDVTYHGYFTKPVNPVELENYININLQSSI